MTGATRTVSTMCPMNCHPTLCGMVVDIRDGKLVGVRGDKDNPDSQGFLCVRGQAAQQIIGNPKRLLKPLVRDRRGTDSWHEASWDQVLDRIAEGITAAGRDRTALWGGHGNLANNYGLSLGSQMLARFANLSGCHYWGAAMICWGLGGFGIGLTGALEINTKEDMGAHSELIVLWGANLASQPNTARHVLAAKARGARIVTIDVRRSEAAAQSDEVLLIRPGTDAALALAVMQVIIGEELYDADFVANHTLGFAELCRHVRPFTPEWAERETGIAAERIAGFARAYATTRPAMILIGGSSLHKGANAWHAARAISCLPALVGSYGTAGGGLGSRHGAQPHGFGFASIAAADRRPPGPHVPDQMSEIAAALGDGRMRALLLFGTNMLSSYAEAGRLAAALERLDLVVCHDLFLSETARRCADIVLPATAWLEDLGCKATHTHIYLTERALEPEGEVRPTQEVLKALAERLGVADFYPWFSQEGLIDAVLDHPATGRASVAALRAAGGRLALNISPVAYPTCRFQTPSGKIEFVSARAAAAGLPPLPVYEARPQVSAADEAPLALCQGRTLTQFHSFYDRGEALPLLAERDPGPQVWISPTDAARRDLAEGAAIRVYNRRGAFAATAHVTARIPEGVAWTRDGVLGLNRVTSGDPVVPQEALGLFPFTVGQSAYVARVEIEAVAPGATGI